MTISVPLFEALAARDEAWALGPGLMARGSIRLWRSPTSFNATKLRETFRHEKETERTSDFDFLSGSLPAEHRSIVGGPLAHVRLRPHAAVERAIAGALGDVVRLDAVLGSL
jgi:hypothetical protein